MPASQARYRPETRLVHAGTLRSQFGETSEALFLTQGYVYDSSAQAERRFKNEEPGYQYSRFSNPTVAMFEARMAVARGRRSRARDRDRHGGGDGRAARPAQGRRSRRRREGAVRLVPLRGRGFPAALRHRLDAGRRHRSRSMEERGAAEHQDLLPRKPDQSDARGHRHRGGRRDRACGRRDARRRQRVRDAAVADAARARRGLRRLFGDQAHRRTGPLPRRRRSSRRRNSSRTTCTT